MTVTLRELNPILSAVGDWGASMGKDEGRRGVPGAWQSLTPAARLRWLR